MTLDEGRCRFNCRTKKEWKRLVEEAYLAGFEDGQLDGIESGSFLCEDYKKEVMNRFYRNWMRGIKVKETLPKNVTSKGDKGDK